jgi:hypothetical protein
MDGVIGLHAFKREGEKGTRMRVNCKINKVYFHASPSIIQKHMDR